MEKEITIVKKADFEQKDGKLYLCIQESRLIFNEKGLFVMERPGNTKKRVVDYLPKV